ncbi:YceK/YidQ family lipoprotein [Pseudomonas sp. Fl5BN2]|uniref:YceK/YidQ family lipoprotein n=1 Tax=Pseudomonas sp. Fl5BN2 TaxID=2697652 RepID=UPI001377302A|nr:YceK/YidQ family lipoprotein [Pseudomonas sp. Fl5BN2]NBF04691.1 YceK/YidQ family lipoprotein [Pseudomonas sp. Fl5BN2]
MRVLIAAAMVMLLGGCSTFAETFGDRPGCGAHPYCGSFTDIELIKAVSDESAGALLALVPLAVIDLPFSVVADTLFLPYTAFQGAPSPH